MFLPNLALISKINLTILGSGEVIQHKNWQKIINYFPGLPGIQAVEGGYPPNSSPNPTSNNNPLLTPCEALFAPTMVRMGDSLIMVDGFFLQGCTCCRWTIC